MCSGIKITATNGDIFFGRTMDLAAGMFGEDESLSLYSGIMNIPKGTEMKSVEKDWTTKYGVIGVGAVDSYCLFDGINEKGLAGDTQVLMECTNDTHDNIEKRGLTPLSSGEFVSYILTQFESVQEIRDHYSEWALSDRKIVLHDVPYLFPLHYSFVDPTGDGIVLEPVDNGAFKIYDYIGAMTNSPEYGWHVTNLRNYIGVTRNDKPEPKELSNGHKLEPIENGIGFGLFGIPGDYTSPSRFIRAALLPTMMDPFDREHGITALYSAFRPVMISRGLQHPNPGKIYTGYTRYWAGYDLAKRELYVQTGNGLAITSAVINNDDTGIKFTEPEGGDYVDMIND